MDWNYYITLNDFNEIRYLDGYKHTKLIQADNSSNNWEFKSKREVSQDYVAKILTDHHANNQPFGRRNWLIDDHACMVEEQEKLLTISHCKFGTQFTCTSGTCVELSRRCDEVFDCDDRSDETECNQVDLPLSYRKNYPPKPLDEKKSLKLLISLQVFNVDSVDTINMVVTLTVQICIKWHDRRLRFFNAFESLDNVVDYEKTKEMWIPTNHLIIDNAIIGDIQYDERTTVQIHPNISQHIGPNLAYENRVYDGSHSLLSVS